ncbi:cbb3-type cytochrome oxidase assembly protein CcoS [Oceanisphaera avium]|uniref:Cbb3-type cytochrome oxidase assembly protein CcoS n=1 Tax=Oceanisphaera avium TaxID=1903694 RepID=A0A1Y0CVN6_9GAMM|nr:cbb3-type cytochrome oxidase assembly protein CcoS [Oceanisphaera avium]ART79309.1 cbb3-type cytochrome oxidase assembly protein CcoS [Oceanisphaera avium]
MTDDVEVWYFMIPVAMVFVGIAIALFFWSVKSDQFEDLDRHGSNILFDDDDSAHQKAQTQHPSTESRKTLNKEQDEHSA